MPSQSETRVKVVVVTSVQPVRSVNDGTRPARQRILSVRVEVAHQSIFGVERTLVRITDAQIDRQTRRQLPVVLKIEAMNRRAGEPTRQLGREQALADVASQETGEGVAGVRHLCAIGL